MSRRKSDKTKDRLLILLAVLAFSSTLLASTVSYKAITALNKLHALIDSASEYKQQKSLLPEGY